MDPYSNSRTHARVTLDPGHSVTFTHAGRTFPGIPMMTLSTGGFGLRLPEAVTAGMEAGQPISGIRFEHPDLPGDVVEGVITHLLAQRHGKSEGFTLMGIRFTEAPPPFQAAVNAYVADHLVL
ncbi:MAG TPA: PilZ domain-containing protein [Holophagaceae bacterium]|nr:PilZ domain-containing protein [Holophagaceae bacterium]